MLRIAALMILSSLVAGCSTPMEPGRYLLDLRTGTMGSTLVEVALDLERDRQGLWVATLRNGAERIEVPVVRTTETGLILDMPHYDSWLNLSFEYLHKAWVIQGTWTKHRGQEFPAVVAVTGQVMINADRTRRGPFHIESALNERTTGRYAVEFSESDGAVLELNVDRNGVATGTVLTPTGDYRYLVGRLDPKLPRRDPESRHRLDTRPPGELYLSTFDGAHMFAMTGTINADGTIEGFFYSGNWWVESFSATQDDQASVPDAFSETEWTGQGGRADLEQLVFTDLDGNPESVADLIRRAHFDNPEVIGPTIVEVFGSWCPNCHDAAAYLAELEAEYSGRGLRVVGLAFELNEDLERSVRQVRAYQDRHGVDWPVLVAGIADKARASEALPVLDRVRSFPTTIFLDKDKNVRGVHTGFTGPATGAAYDQMRAEYEVMIEGLLED